MAAVTAWRQSATVATAAAITAATAGAIAVEMVAIAVDMVATAAATAGEAATTGGGAAIMAGEAATAAGTGRGAGQASGWVCMLRLCRSITRPSGGKAFPTTMRMTSTIGGTRRLASTKR